MPSLKRLCRILLLEFLIIALASLLCHAQARSQTIHLVAGTVHDPTDAAIVGAEVDLVLPDGRIVSQVKTDFSGNFRFARVQSGNYRLEAQHEGFRLTTVNVKVGDRQQVTANIVLPIAVA